MKNLLLFISIFALPFMSLAQEMVRVMVIGKKKNGCGVMYSATKFHSEVCKQEDADFVETKLKNEIGNSLNLHTKRIYAGQYCAVIKAKYQPLLLSCTYTDYAIGVSKVSKVDAINDAKNKMNSRSGKLVSHTLVFDGQVPVSKPVATSTNSNNSSSIDKLNNSLNSTLDVSQEEWNKQAESFRNESKPTQEEIEKRTSILPNKTYEPSEGIIKVRENNLYGFKDANGKWIVYPKYSYASDFSNGIAEVNNGAKVRIRNNQDWTEGGLWGFIDKTGIEIIPIKYEDKQYFNYKGLLFPLKLNGKWGVVDNSNNSVIPFKYDGILSIKETAKGIVIAAKQYNDTLYFTSEFKSEKTNGTQQASKPTNSSTTNKNVSTSTTPKKYEVEWETNVGLKLVRLNGKYAFIDKAGKEITAFKYDGSDTHFEEGFNWVELNKKSGLIDKTGKEITFLKYDWHGVLEKGLWLVRSDGKYGFIDKTGKEVIPVIYDDIETHYDESINHGYVGFWIYKGSSKVKAKVKLNGRTFYIDRSGKEVK